MAKKLDGVIEAVRYKNGQIVVVRAYERRGATYSDHVLLDRKTLVERLQRGQQFVLGTRKALHASTFQVGPAVMLVHDDGHEWVATHSNVHADELEGAPVF